MHQLAINTTPPNSSNYEILLKGVKKEKMTMYVYYLDNLIKQKKIEYYNIDDSINTKRIHITFSMSDTVNITNLLMLKGKSGKKLPPSEQIFIANYQFQQDTIFYRINGNVITKKFVFITQNTPLLGYKFYPSAR